MQLMQKMTDVENKVDNMAAKVDGAIQVATEAKEDAKQVKVAVETLRGEVGNMKNGLEQERKNQVEWQTMLEGKVSAAEIKVAM